MRTVTTVRSVLRARTLALPLVLAAAIFVPGTPAAGTADAASPYLSGIDVSRWQGTIDWSAVGRTNVSFVFAKATQGRYYNDPTYAANRAGARAAGIRFGAYHYAEPDMSWYDAVHEADHFVSVAGLRSGNLIPVLDLEETGGMSTYHVINWVRTWVQRVQARTGVRPMIYTSALFWRYRMGNTTWFAANGYRVWIASWGVSSPSVPANNWNSRGWSFWQTSSCGRVSGISGCVDLDYANGQKLTLVVM